MTLIPNAQKHGFVFGLAGFSGSGKTVLAEKLIAELCSRGRSVASIKHAHHAFDADTKGKDSWRHRKAGASQVIVSSPIRRVQFTEVTDGIEASLNTLLGELAAADFVLVEGYKKTPFPKIEIWRAVQGNPFLYPTIEGVRLVASDTSLPQCPLPVVDLNDTATLTDAIEKRLKL